MSFDALVERVIVFACEFSLFLLLEGMERKSAMPLRPSVSRVGPRLCRRRRRLSCFG